MAKLEIIVNEMKAHHGPVPMDLGNVGTHGMKMTQSDTTFNDMSYEDVSAIAWKGYLAGEGDDARKYIERTRVNGLSGSGSMEARFDARRVPTAQNPMATAIIDKESKGKCNGNGKGKSETRYCYDCGEQGAHWSEMSVQVGT